MSRQTSRAVIALTLMAVASGCAPRAIPALPSSLEDEGLLVARMYVLGMQGIENASIEIDGNLRPSAMRDGYIAIPLRPGVHTLSKIQAEGRLLAEGPVEREAPIRLARGGSVPTFIYIPGSSRIVHYTTLSIDREFMVESGRVTNLGLLVYLPVLDPPDHKSASTNGSRQFKVLTVDNGAETSAFLETNYPELMRSLPRSDLLLAPGRYLEAAKLPDLRRAIAYHESRGPHVVLSPSRMAVYGRAGTVLLAGRDAAEGPQPPFEVLDTGTLADVVGAVRHGERFTFVTSDAKILSWEDGTLTKASLPQRLQPVGLYAVGERGLVVIDNRMRFLVTRELGEPWEDYQGAMVGTPRNDLLAASEEAGAYVAVGNRDLPSKLYYLKAGTSVPEAVVTPVPDPNQPVEGPYQMYARPAGLYLMYNGPRFLFWSRSTRRWSRNTLPEGGACRAMRLDETGYEITLECAGVTYRSGNGGSTWRRPET